MNWTIGEDGLSVFTFLGDFWQAFFKTQGADPDVESDFKELIKC